MSEFTHIDDDRTQLVDISAKERVDRVTIAEGTITLQPETITAIEADGFDKGNVLQTARIAGIQSVKRTAETIPLCHPIPITGSSIEFERGEDQLTARVRVTTTAQTGVEMEALNGVSGALLTIWDMVKSAEKDDAGQYPHTRIGDIHVVEKVKTSP